MKASRKLLTAAAGVGIAFTATFGSVVLTGPRLPAFGAVVDRDRSPADSTFTYEVDGIQIIHRRGAPNSVVAANLYLLGGTRNVTPETAGLEPMLLELSEYGTRGSTRDALLRRLARLGTSIEIGAAADWTIFGIRATTDTFDSTWAIFADRLMNPRVDSAAVELVRAQLLSGVHQTREDPDALAEYLADSIAFAGHAYAISPVGTELSLGSITRMQLAEFHQRQIVKSRMLLVIVGNVERSTVERLVRGTLALLPEGSYRWSLPPQPPVPERAVVFVQRALPTNYILGYFHGPPADSRDYAALRIACAVLSGQLFAEIRSRRNLTYAVDAPFVERALSAGGIYVTAVSPDLTLRLIAEEIAALQEGEISREGLSSLVLQFITEYFLDNETNAAQADFLARAQLYSGDFRKADAFAEELRSVRPADVRAAARKYMRNFRFAYVGDSTKISRGTLSRY